MPHDVLSSAAGLLLVPVVVAVGTGASDPVIVASLAPTWRWCDHAWRFASGLSRAEVNTNRNGPGGLRKVRLPRFGLL